MATAVARPGPRGRGSPLPKRLQGRRGAPTGEGLPLPPPFVDTGAAHDGRGAAAASGLPRPAKSAERRVLDRGLVVVG